MYIDSEKQYKASLEFLDGLYESFVIQKNSLTKMKELTPKQVNEAMEPLVSFILGVEEDIKIYEKENKLV